MTFMMEDCAMGSQICENKSRSNKPGNTDFIKIKKFCVSKGTIKTVKKKIAHRMGGKKITKHDSNKGLISRTHNSYNPITKDNPT